MRWTITSARLPRGAQSRPLPAAGQGLRWTFLTSLARLAFPDRGRGALGRARRATHRREHGQRTLPFEAHDGHIAEEKKAGGADIEEEEFHGHLPEVPHQSLVFAALGVGFRAGDRVHEIRMEPASSIGESKATVGAKRARRNLRESHERVERRADGPPPSANRS